MKSQCCVPSADMIALAFGMKWTWQWRHALCCSRWTHKERCYDVFVLFGIDTILFYAYQWRSLCKKCMHEQHVHVTFNILGWIMYKYTRMYMYNVVHSFRVERENKSGKPYCRMRCRIHYVLLYRIGLYALATSDYMTVFLRSEGTLCLSLQ